MIEINEVVKGIFCFHIPMSGNPLKWLNCYLVKGLSSGKNLLIDCGYHINESISVLFEALSQFGCLPQNTDVFLTHMHDDHTGNASLLRSEGYKILMGRRDYEIWMEGFVTDWAALHSRILSEGFPKDPNYSKFVIEQPREMKSGYFCPELLEDGDQLHYGNFNFVCIETPGHTPGHLCLYDESSRTMILGDHVLFDITPNICARNGVSDPLADYLKSLDKIRSFDVRYALTGHRSIGEKNLNERVDEIIAHHHVRLEEICGILKQEPELTAYDVAGRMTWSLRSGGWTEAPLRQKFFAIGETLAHLDHLAALWKIESLNIAGKKIYKLK